MRLPCLVTEDFCVWDSLAICKTLNELYPNLHMHPKNISDKAMARSISNEIHSGFQTMRTKLPINLDMNCNYELTDADLIEDIKRAEEIIETSLEKSKGAYLFCELCIADAMLAPFIMRFISYSIPPSKIATQYRNAILANSAVKEWIGLGVSEVEIIDE